MSITITAGEQLVHRPARTRPPAVPEGILTLAAPPKIDAMQAGVTSWLQYLFPVVGGLGAMLFIVTNPKPLFLASGLLFMLGSIGMGVGMAMQQRMAGRRRTRAARARYLEYLAAVRGQLRATAAAQRAASSWRHPAPEALLSLAGSPARLWERRPDDRDFLDVRFGQGTRPLATPVLLPHTDGAQAAADPVCASAAEQLVKAFDHLAEDPIAIDLKEARVVSIAGGRAATLDLVRALCAQVAIFHSPDDVHLLVGADVEDAADWEWIKWLPHLEAQDDGGTSFHDLAGLEAAIAERVAKARRGMHKDQDAGPWLIAIADGVVPSPDTVAALRKTAARTSLIAISSETSHGVGELDARIRVDHGRFALDHLVADGAEGRADRMGRHGAEAMARRLAPLRASDSNSSRRASSDISLTSMLNLGDLAALDVARGWRKRPLAEILSVPIGLSSEGDAVRLDLKESALGGDGPHGLVIGATGSGKSELLRTVVTGLALTHPPDQLAFVLVDFKGGAAFAGLQGLPHVAGLITNLADDLALVDRMYAALFGEIRRRQEHLRAAGNLATLRDYHRRIDEGERLTALPYLLVIVDEFGELLTARPDFIDLFVAVGRLGRSLGMHLLLASQQLDEGRLRGLEGHLSYRIALRTFSAAESRTVLGVPDAYELPPVPGSAYLKVGTTVYTRFRAATVSQPYVTRAMPAGARARPYNVPATPTAENGGQAEPSAGTSVLEVAVARLRDGAPRVHQVWLPPLEHRVSLDTVLRQRGPAGQLSVPLGLVDKPAEQSRDVLMADLAGSAGHLLVVGASLTGKTTLLRTLVSSFAFTHSPLEAQFYCIDFGGGGLSVLSKLPHVGGVAGRQDPERVRRTVMEVATMLDEREARFAAAGIDSPATLRARRARSELEGTGWADVFLVIDNWPAVRQEFEELEAPLQQIASRGLGYAVHLVLTANRWIDVRSALRESVGGRLELRLHDPAESAINRREAENVAKGMPGRGITSEALHFQVALPRIDGSTDVLDLQRGLEQLIAKTVSVWRGPRARPVLVLPRMVLLAELTGERSTRGVIIGVSERNLKPVALDMIGGEPHFLVFGDGESGKTNFLRTYLTGLMSSTGADRAQVLVIDYRRNLLGVVKPDFLLGYAGAEPSATAQVAETATVLTKRLPPADLSIEQLRTRSWWKGPEVFVVADDYDLVATPGGNPLLPLLPLLAQAKDVGLHVLIARRVGGAGRGVLEPVMLRVRELGTPGLVLSGDPQEGALLGPHRAGPQPPGRGMLVRGHERPVLIQVAFSGRASSRA
jgi:ESX secretion system protein EccC